jgi:hypothetical protein
VICIQQTVVWLTYITRLVATIYQMLTSNIGNPSGEAVWCSCISEWLLWRLGNMSSSWALYIKLKIYSDHVCMLSTWYWSYDICSSSLLFNNFHYLGSTWVSFFASETLLFSSSLGRFRFSVSANKLAFAFTYLCAIKLCTIANPIRACVSLLRAMPVVSWFWFGYL